MTEAARVWTTVGANIAPLEAGLATASAKTEKFGASFGATLAAHTKKMESFGRSLRTNVTLPILAVSAAGVKMSMDFQRNMALIQTSAGASAGDVKVLTGAALDLAKKGPYGPNELAKALYHLKSLGYDNVTAMHALRVAQNGAMVGNSDLESTTSALGAAIRTNIKGTGDFGKAMATLNGIVGAGNMRMPDLIAALGTGLLPAAKAAGLDLRNTGAALALMTDEGMGAQQAATRLRMAFSLMAAPSKKANDALHMIHLSGSQLGMAMQGPDGLVKAIELLKTHLGELGHSRELSAWAKDVDRGRMSLEQFTARAAKTEQFQVLSRAFGGGRSSAAILLMVNNLNVLEQKLRQIDKTTAAYPADVIKARAEDVNKLKTSWSNVQVALIKGGQTLTPFVLSMSKGLANIAGWFSNLSEKTRKWLAIFGVSAALAGPALIFMAKMITAIKTIAALTVTQAETSTATTSVVAANMERQAAAVNTLRLSFTTLDGAFATEGAASTAATGVVVRNMTTQGEAIAGAAAEASLLGRTLIGIASLGPIVIGLSFVKASSKGQKALDQYHLGPLGHLPFIGNALQQTAKGAVGTGSAFDHLMGVPNHDEAAKQKANLLRSVSATGLKDTNDYSGFEQYLKAFGLSVTKDQYAKIKGIFAGTYTAATSAGKHHHLTEAQERAKLARQAKADYEALMKKVYGSAGYTPPALPGDGSGGGSGSGKGYKLPASLQAAQARADALAAANPNLKHATALQIKVAHEVKTAAMKAIESHTLTMKGIKQAWNIVKGANQTLGLATIHGNVTSYASSLTLQVSQARADALAALNPNAQGPTALQITLAKKVKTEAMKAIDSHTLTMDALISAWNIVSQANSTLAQSLSGNANSYVAVSTKSLTAGLHLSHDAAVLIRERAAQAAAHGGMRPVGPAAQGQVVYDLRGSHFHGVHDIKKLHADLKKVDKHHGQRAGQR